VLFFSRKKTCQRKKSSYPKIASRLPAYIHTCVLCTHTNLQCAEIWSIWFLRALQVSSRPQRSHRSTPYAVWGLDPRAHIGVPHMQCASQCNCTHRHMGYCVYVYVLQRVLQRVCVKCKWLPTRQQCVLQCVMQCVYVFVCVAVCVAACVCMCVKCKWLLPRQHTEISNLKKILKKKKSST